eukprot:TRINITY_DN7314_c0_g1_i2.p1 TRINITY_DN7314_c0_g1~~TRINITY_DN7314_c0_g1_i2.p1  ORF type:complete len:428 (+),score=44.54 TRINITY_DN7314_c0_g1_i2:805-2088(+)
MLSKMAAMSTHTTAAVPPFRSWSTVDVPTAGKPLHSSLPARRSGFSGSKDWSSLGLQLASLTAFALPASLVAHERRRSARRSRIGSQSRSHTAGLRRSVSLHATSSESAGSSTSVDVDEAEDEFALAPPTPAPEDLYELLGVAPTVDQSVVKQAYYSKMKLCHPDVAGEEAAEMCMLLNDAYDLLSDPESREQYNEQIKETRKEKYQASDISWTWQNKGPQDTDDYGPTWNWQAKAYHGSSTPTYLGQPYSRSLWDRVPPEERGEKHDMRQFVYVEEFRCIACRNCCDVAHKTFCIDSDSGRARAFAQWGNSEEDLDYAVMSCPVDCISWVSRRELQALEYVTRKGIYEVGGQLPCSMAIRAGRTPPDMLDAFTEASQLNQSLEDEALRRRSATNAKRLAASALKLRDRIAGAFALLGSGLKKAGWG